MKSLIRYLLVALLLGISLPHYSRAASIEENTQFYQNSRKTLAEMQKQLWKMRTWWEQKKDLDAVARHLALSTISPLKGADDYFVYIDQRLQYLYHAYESGYIEEESFYSETDRLMDEALSKLYWSYIYHTKARIRDMQNHYQAERDAALSRYQQQLQIVETQYGRLSENADERSRQLLAALANYDSTLRIEAKEKYVNAMQEAVLLRRHIAQQIIAWIDILNKSQRQKASEFFTMRLYDLLEYQLADKPDAELEKIFSQTLWGGKDVSWIKYNGSSLDRDLLDSREGSFIFTPLQVEVPGPGYLKQDRTVAIGKSETINLKSAFAKEPIAWLIKNQTVKQAM